MTFVQGQRERSPSTGRTTTSQKVERRLNKRYSVKTRGRRSSRTSTSHRSRSITPASGVSPRGAISPMLTNVNSSLDPPILPQITTTFTSPPPSSSLSNSEDHRKDETSRPSPTSSKGQVQLQTSSPRSRPSSPSTRSPTSIRPLSPDLPNSDALYLFSNFSSYMRSPHEGGEGVRAEDFKDTIRLLDHARALAAQPRSNVHVLHLKYRFQGQVNPFRSPYSSGDYQLPLNYRDPAGKLRTPVPQPFSVLHDPVVKIDYMENGVFEPLPAQAVFSHIAKMCQPPPRIIVISYVYSKVIDNHLASLSTWALTSSPPAYVFSPVETRIREPQPLHLALHQAIPMSMYAWPAEGPSPTSPGPRTSPFTFSPTGSENASKFGEQRSGNSEKDDAVVSSFISPNGQGHDTTSPILLTRHISSSSDAGVANGFETKMTVSSETDIGKNIHSLKRHPSDPIASLTVINSSLDPSNEEESQTKSPSRPRPADLTRTQTSTSVPPPVDRIPLWQLAPGVGVLHGSTSASIGIKLSDFSAINLVGEGGKIDKSDAQKGMKSFQVKEMGIRTSPMDLSSTSHLSTIEKDSDTHFPTGYNKDGKGGGGLVSLPALLKQPISRPSSTAPPAAVNIAAIPSKPTMTTTINAQGVTHLSPPEVVPRSLAKIALTHGGQSWPSPVSRVPGWRKGRKEMMEDIMDEIAPGPVEDMFEVEEISRNVDHLQLESDNDPSRSGEEGDSFDIVRLLTAYESN
ncbi:hypothetical protein IAR55_004876 [Kwoniella newhampshirensis]|uniref:Uncharacterized protein n=1 Tax=Kwoniella newhampshirensis TaxID=1651941 RepID=A0AAW0YJF2_9TREE